MTTTVPATPLHDAQPAGLFLPKNPFVKRAIPVSEQIALLQRRGMAIEDPARAEHYLRFVGYYRLSGYWFPLQHRNGSARKDDFKPGASFDLVLDRYVFDRRLRVLVMDAVERIEVAARAIISDTMSERHGPHWFLNAVHFTNPFNHAGFIKRLRREAGINPADPNRQTQSVAHYLSKYDSPDLPPSWMVFEAFSFGTVSTIYSRLTPADQKVVARAFGLPKERLRSWLHSLSHLRNVCAHHGRLWNKRFAVAPSMAKADKRHVNEALGNTEKFYAHAVAIEALLKIISPDTRWGERLARLLDEHPDVPKNEMGFPPGWRRHPAWR